MAGDGRKVEKGKKGVIAMLLCIYNIVENTFWRPLYFIHCRFFLILGRAKDYV